MKRRAGAPMAWVDRRCRAAVLERFRQLDGGQLRARDPDGEWRVGVPGTLDASVEVAGGEFWRMLATGGSVGAGEAYEAGLWETPDLTGVIRLLAANRRALDAIDAGGARFHGWLRRGLHRLSRNTLGGSRRNIAAHYDLGNDFFARWLDDRMQYSSALFTDQARTLEAAQEAKLARIADRLRLGPDDHLLEIGTGWGGLAIYMAETTGCRVTTTTISGAQYRHAIDAVARAGLADRVRVLKRDYRELDGRFDKVVSVEMIEAVGAEYLDCYLATVRDRLDPAGLALIQAITIEDYRYASALKSVDFIKRYIFPGSFIPSVGAITAAMARSTDLGLIELFDLGESYARTLRCWRERFEAAWEDIRRSGFDEAFRRRWRYYLAYCEGGFAERAISDVQLLFAGPEYRK